MRVYEDAHVEVREDDQQTPVFRSQHVLSGYLGIVECDISGTSRGRVRSLDRLGLDSFGSGDEEDCQPAVGLYISSDSASHKRNTLDSPCNRR